MTVLEEIATIVVRCETCNATMTLPDVRLDDGRLSSAAYDWTFQHETWTKHRLVKDEVAA